MPADGKRIKPQTDLANLVNNTVLTNFEDANFAGGMVSVINSSTDAPATDDRSRSTLWFERGAGRMMKWTPLPTPTETTPGWPTSEFRFVQLSGARRTNLVFIIDVVPETGTVLGPSTTLTEWMAIRSDGNLGPDQYTMGMRRGNATSSGMGRDFIFDPVMVAEEPVGAQDVLALADWGFVQARVKGNGKFCLLDGTHGSGVTFPQEEMICTGYSSAGDNACIVGILSQSDTTDGNRLATVFLCPQITNLVRGEN